MTAHNVLKAGESILAHVVAIIAGVVMMGVGIGMGVTMVLLPVGLPLGLIGAGVFTWGAMGYRGSQATR